MYLVTGATGNIGRDLTAQLANAEEEVRALTRDPARAALPSAAQLVAGDFSDTTTLAAALAGVDGAFLNVMGDPAPLARALQTADVPRLVLVSSLCAGTRFDLIYADHFRHIEETVRAVRPDVVVLRPGQFMSNTLMWRPMIARGLVRAPFADVALPMIDPADIASVAAAILRGGPEHAGRTYNLSGHEALSVRHKVAILSQELDCPLGFEEQDQASFRAALERLPTQVVDYMIAMMGAPTPPELAHFPTVTQLTGRQSATFADWVSRHRDELVAG